VGAGDAAELLAPVPEAVPDVVGRGVDPADGEGAGPAGEEAGGVN
jgi:hypothetical protein